MAVLRFHADRFGWPAWLGSALIVLGLGFDALVTAPLETELEGLLSESRLVTPVSRAERARQPHLLAGIELARRDMASLEALFDAADRAGIVLQQGEYRLENAGGGATRRLRIQFPLRAPYPALRHFLADSLNQNPTLALDSVRLRRDTHTQAELDVRVHFVLQLGEP